MDTALQIITIVLALVGLLAPPIGLYLRKIGKQEAADMVDAVGKGVDKAKMMLTPEQAKAMTHAIKAQADQKGVLDTLDALLAAADRNTKTRNELIDSAPE
jgi:hypothetical protein